MATEVSKVSGSAGPRHRKPSAQVLWLIFGRLVLILFRVRRLGLESVPTTGGLVLSGNHRSYADPVILWSVSSRPVYFMGKAELWESRIVAWALSIVEAFPVRRGKPDRDALMRATKYLDAGEVIGVFPEGTRVRGGETLEPNEGAAFVAMRANVPIVPVGISGTNRILPEGKRLPRLPQVTVCYGRPISPDEYAHLGRRERLSAITARVMQEIEIQLARAEGL